MKTIMDASEISRALTRIAAQIVEANKGAKDVVLVGIISRGGMLAERLSDLISKNIKKKVAFGAIDVSMYRDDLEERGKDIEMHQSDLSVPIDDKVVVLVDDVLFSGRTIRAAMDSLNDYGRPSKIQLAVLIDRGLKELPIHADFIGKTIQSTKTDNVVVNLKEDDGVDKVFIK